MYKLIVLDLDGTLTNAKKEITLRTKQVLLRVQQKGMKIVLASGRPTCGIIPLAEELELSKYGGFILSYNGGVRQGSSLSSELLSVVSDECQGKRTADTGYGGCLYTNGGEISS